MASMGKAMMGTGEAEGEGRAIKAAEMAISNPLIDDYTLKGAKGLLVNITGGKDLKLFEVDEAVNKVRAEVDPEAELIIGAITDPELDGKMRVSIVATSLDGQQPETKSVINMVHRIQNRNPGYSDFAANGLSQSFSFGGVNSNPVSHGANALKLENEIVSDNLQSQSKNQSVNDVNNQYHEELLKNQEIGETKEIISESNESSLNEKNLETSEIEQHSQNDLREFGVETDEPDLFSSENANLDTYEFLNSAEDEKEDEDFEIPAFLRRQKN